MNFLAAPTHKPPPVRVATLQQLMRCFMDSRLCSTGLTLRSGQWAPDWPDNELKKLSNKLCEEPHQS